MKAAELFLEKVEVATNATERLQVIREIQADALKATGQFAFDESEFVLAAKMAAAAESIMALGGKPTPVRV
jgi:hypothetical protein